MKEKAETNPEELWSEKRLKSLREFILKESASQSPEQRLDTEMLAIKYAMEHYIVGILFSELNGESTEFLSIQYFIKRYMKALDVTQKQLAELFKMKDSNLHKYLTGERKLNADVAFKLASFTKTSPEHWFRLEIRNELKKLGKERTAEFEKYGYQNLVTA